MTARVGVSPDGSLSSCVEGDPPTPLLGGVFCRAVVARAKFLPALDRKGLRVADTVTIKATIVGVGVPTAPMLPRVPGDYDDPLIMPAAQTMTLEAAPDWSRFHPGKAGASVVNMVAYRIQPDGTASVYCVPLEYDRDPALAKAACSAMEKAKYRTNPALPRNEMTALVHWRDGGDALIESAVAGKRGKSLLWANRAAQKVPGLTIVAGMSPQAQLDFEPAAGTPTCRVIASAGTDADDVAACKHLETLGFTAPVDIFGRKFAVRRAVRIEAKSEPAAEPRETNEASKRW